MDIYEMIEQGVPIYVINRSATVLGKPLLLMIEFPNPNGGRKATVKLPPIQFPVCLSQRVAPPSAIGMSQDFIDLVNRGVLEVVAPDRARKILANPEAQAAVNLAFKKLDKRRARPGGIQAKKPNFRVVNGGTKTTQSTPYFDEEQITPSTFVRGYPGDGEDANQFSENDLEIDVAPQDELQNSATVNPRIMQICADLQGNPELKQEYLLEIKSMDPDSLSQEDLGYITDNLRGFDTIIAYIRGLMAKRVGGVQQGRKSKKSRPVEDVMDSALDE